jgi:hypothetical protein
MIIFLNHYFLVFAAAQILVTFIPTRQLSIARNLLSDIIFQQTMLYLLFASLVSYEDIVHFLYFIGAVTISHLPIMLLKHVNLKGKLVVLLALVVAATLIYFAFRNFHSSLSLLIALTIHFGFYFIIMQTPTLHKTGIII